MRIPAVLGVLTFLLAGCAGSTPDGSPGGHQGTGGLVAPPPVEEGTPTGGIRVQVTDPEGMPVRLAIVSVFAKQGDDYQSDEFTDDDGRARFGRVPVGAYVMHVQREGYSTISSREALVEKGRIADVQVELEPLASFEAFHKSVDKITTWTQYICPYVMGAPQGKCGISYTGGILLELDVEEATEGDLMALVVEARWTPTVSACNPGMRTSLFSPQQENIGQSVGSNAAAQHADNPYFWDNLPNDSSPTHLFVPRGTSIQGSDDPLRIRHPGRETNNGGQPLTLDGTWTVALEAIYKGYPDTGVVDLACTYDQDVNTWITAFFVDPPATTDWSAFA